MTTPYTHDGSGALEGSYNLPDEGDNADAASVDVPFETIIRDVSRALYRKRIQVSVTRYLTNGVPVADVGSTSAWQKTFVAGTGFPWIQGNVTAPTNGAHVYTLDYPLLIPDQASLTSVTADITPANHPTNLPATMPNIAIDEYDPSTNVLTALCNVSDLSANVAAYNPRHTFSVSTANMPGGVAIPVDRSKILHVRFTGEFGANSVALLVLNSLRVAFSTANEDPGAG